MKKIISICLSISLLCGCGGMKGLQRQSTQNVHQMINENNELYYNAETGHNSKVKMFVLDEQHARIKIPVNYTEKIENIEKLKMVPNITTQEMDALYDAGNCTNCILDKESLTINISYKDGNARADMCAYFFALSPILLPISLIFSGSLASIKEGYEDFCVKNKLQDAGPIRISEPTGTLKLKDMGAINTTFDVIPKSINLSCNKKSCSVVDENGKFVNKILIYKIISANQKRIDELIAEDKKVKAQESKRKAEEDRKWKLKMQQQKKECPGLYRTLYWAQQTGYIDPIIGMKTAKRFEELDCQWWLQDQMDPALH